MIGTKFHCGAKVYLSWSRLLYHVEQSLYFYEDQSCLDWKIILY